MKDTFNEVGKYLTKESKRRFDAFHDLRLGQLSLLIDSNFLINILNLWWNFPTFWMHFCRMFMLITF